MQPSLYIVVPCYNEQEVLPETVRRLGAFLDENADLLAENSRLPVDNPDTHLELTMIHECMTLEYSGRLLSYIHLGSMLKMLSFFVLFGALYLPLPLPMVVKVLMTALLVGLVEILNNKMRLFKVRVYLAAAVIMLAVAIIAQ